MRTDLAMESMFEELDSSPRANGIHAIHAKTLDSQVSQNHQDQAMLQTGSVPVTMLGNESQPKTLFREWAKKPVDDPRDMEGTDSHPAGYAPHSRFSTTS